jgi:hypothetical protein
VVANLKLEYENERLKLELRKTKACDRPCCNPPSVSSSPRTSMIQSSTSASSTESVVVTCSPLAVQAVRSPSDVSLTNDAPPVAECLSDSHELAPSQAIRKRLLAGAAMGIHRSNSDLRREPDSARRERYLLEQVCYGFDSLFSPAPDS